MRSFRQTLLVGGAGVAVVLNTFVPAQATPCSLQGLQWMRGVWHDDSDRTKVEERWTVGPDYRLLGSSYALHPGAVGGVLEVMTIAPDASEVSMRIRHFDNTLDHAREEKDAPMIFVVANCDANSVVLEGRGSQTGERMTYRRDGDKLSFVGDFIHQGKPVRAAEMFARVGE